MEQDDLFIEEKLQILRDEERTIMRIVEGFRVRTNMVVTTMQLLFMATRCRNESITKQI